MLIYIFFVNSSRFLLTLNEKVNRMNKGYFLSPAMLAVVILAAASCTKKPVPVPETALESANCHIISAPGYYSFPAVKGNSSERIGDVAYAEVLWESFGTSETPAKGEIIADVGYSSRDGHIHLKTPRTLKDGNALVAAKDISGTILWSWHIWVCDGWDPVKTAQAYYHNAGVMMDRNLGATSNVPGDVSALGLLYQWGRKDPFLGSSSISDDAEAASTLTWPAPVLSTQETGTIAYAVAHPTTFICAGEDNYDWYYTGEFVTDNTRWQDNKSIYDPCPAGWKLPNGSSPFKEDLWMTAINRRFVTFPMDYELLGLNLSRVFGDADPIWYPLAGTRADYTGALKDTGRYGGYWSSTPDLDEADPEAKVMALGLDMDITKQGDVMVFPSYDYCRGFALSVRCVADKAD